MTVTIPLPLSCLLNYSARHTLRLTPSSSYMASRAAPLLLKARPDHSFHSHSFVENPFEETLLFVSGGILSSTDNVSLGAWASVKVSFRKVFVFGPPIPSLTCGGLAGFKSFMESYGMNVGPPPSILVVRGVP